MAIYYALQNICILCAIYIGGRIAIYSVGYLRYVCAGSFLSAEEWEQECSPKCSRFDWTLKTALYLGTISYMLMKNLVFVY